MKDLRNRKWDEILTDEELRIFDDLADNIITWTEDISFFQIKRIIDFVMEYDNVEDLGYSILDDEGKKELDEMNKLDNKRAKL